MELTKADSIRVGKERKVKQGRMEYCISVEKEGYQGWWTGTAWGEYSVCKVYTKMAEAVRIWRKLDNKVAAGYAVILIRRGE